jgi:hypothetical protein
VKAGSRGNGVSESGCAGGTRWGTNGAPGCSVDRCGRRGLDGTSRKVEVGIGLAVVQRRLRLRQVAGWCSRVLEHGQ